MKGDSSSIFRMSYRSHIADCPVLVQKQVIYIASEMEQSNYCLKTLNIIVNAIFEYQGNLLFIKYCDSYCTDVMLKL